MIKIISHSKKIEKDLMTGLKSAYKIWGEKKSTLSKGTFLETNKTVIKTVREYHKSILIL